MPDLIPRLSVCFFSHSSQLAGAGRSLLELITELIKDHETVCYVVLPDNGPLKEKLEDVGASTLIVDYSWWCDFSRPTVEEINTRLNHSLRMLLERIRSDLVKINPDVVFTNTMVIPWGAVTASLLGKPHVWFVHEFGQLDHKLKFYLPFQRILKIIRDSSNLVLTNSNAVRRTLFGKTDDENIVTINQHIDICDVSTQEDSRSYFLRANSIKLIVNGTISESKGQEDAVLAVKELVQKKKDVELIIMGGHAPWYLKKLGKIVREENLEKYVRFHEFCEDPYSVVNQADIVLLSSRHEAFGRVTIEAMLLKKPVIGTNSGATPELIREGHNGLLYEPGDYRQLADKIGYLIEHREKIREFGENGFEFAKTTFTKETYGGELYKRLTDLRSEANLSSSPYFSFVTERLLDLQAAAKTWQQALEEKEEQIKSLTAERDRFSQEAEQLRATLQGQQHSMAQMSEDIYQLQHSVSYRFSLFCRWPLRKLWHFARSLFEGRGFPRVQIFAYQGLRTVFRLLPLKQQSRLRLKHFVFRYFPFLRPRSFGDETTSGIVSHELQPSSVASHAWLQEFYGERFDHYEPMSNSPVAETEIHLIAFYLPQFHPIPDNDRWWGRGFTEWTNVTKAKPQYIGHYQPHLPGEFGFYDLRLIDVQKRQIDLARHYGIHGFCYYYYWFSGKRVLERPLDQVLRHRELDLPFCICWANENWTRRWDGLEQDVLLAQEHRPDDDLELIQDLEPVLKDERYIKVDGKPLLIVYRVDILPNPKKTVKTWRDHCLKARLGEIYLVGAKTFGFEDPVSLGFDAAVEFPPHNITPLEITADVTPLNPAFRGHVYSYRDFMDKAISVDKTQHTAFRTVMVNWDNTPRRAGAAHMFADSTPSLYQSWLEAVCDHTIRNLSPGKRLVFINAWNEWAEGAHLEPDRQYGYAYLNATANAIRKYDVSKRVSVNRAKKLISVVLPSYNHEQYVGKALDSLKIQTQGDLEIIVVDDGSTDATPEVVQTFIDRHRGLNVRFLKQRNRGAHASINRGVAEATGDYIAILNSDDFYHHERLEVLLDALKRTNSKLAFSNIEIIDEDGAPVNENDYAVVLRTKINEIKSFPNIGYALLDWNVAISTGNLMFKREVFDLVGGFSDLKFCHDWDFILTALRYTDPIFVDKALYYYRLHRSNTISEAERTGEEEAARVLAKFFVFEQSQSHVRCNFPSRRNDGAYFAKFVRQHGFDKYIVEAKGLSGKGART
jgi:glycosyltransferase involved in cell wall biosynthesis